MGLWAFHTFIRTTDLPALEQALQQVCSLDGYQPIPKPLPEQSIQRRSSQYGEQVYIADGFLGIFLMAATSVDQEWTYLKCAPDSFLCERAQGASQPRLAALAQVLGCDAFWLEMTDGDSMVLLECSSDGTFRVSGASMFMLEEAYAACTEETSAEEWDSLPVLYFDEQVEDTEPSFSLLIDLAAFNPDDDIEAATNDIEAEFLGSMDDAYLSWIYENKLFGTESVDESASHVRELYFRRMS
jgi:hypothetical protein